VEGLAEVMQAIAIPDEAGEGAINIGALPRITDIKAMTGVQRAAVLLMTLGAEHGAFIWEDLDEEEIKQISVAMARLGEVETSIVERLLVDFATQMTASGALMGNFTSTERLLARFMPPDKVAAVMEEIRGPAGRNMWEKLSNVQESVLAAYLKNEYPQTVAVVLSKIKPDHAASVLSIFPEEFALEVVDRMLRMESIQKEVLDRVEQTLRSEFMSNLAQTRRRDAHEMMAEIFNNFDRQTESRFLAALEEGNRDAAERIKALMFTFEDLAKLDPPSIQTLLRQVAKDRLALAIKGASDSLRDLFFSNMSERAGKMLRQDMEVMGPVRLKDVDEAQTVMVNLAKDLAAKGEIVVTKNRGDDELIY
jgi:flagellar motor switch protein FliG